MAPETSTISTQTAQTRNISAIVHVPTGCQIMMFANMSFIASESQYSGVGAEAEEITRKLKDLVFLPVMFLIGAPANFINMAVFYKQGLKERVNLCLFALALADELYLIQAMICSGEQLRKIITGPILRFMINNDLVALNAFRWVSQILSAIIASERCLCVLSPIRFRTLLKTRTMGVIITVIFLLIVGLYFIVAERFRIICLYDLVSGTALYISVTSEFYKKHEKLVTYLDSFMYGICIPGASIIVVTTTTAITAMKIRQAAKWRAGTSSSRNSLSIPLREIALNKMLIGRSILFIICISPTTICRFIWLFLPEFNIGRHQEVWFFTTLWLSITTSLTNSAVNIVVYYSMGSLYRKTFRAMFSCQKCVSSIQCRMFRTL